MLLRETEPSAYYRGMRRGLLIYSQAALSVNTSTSKGQAC